MVRVPLDLCVEEVDGGVLGPLELVGVVEVLASLRDRPVGVVVELLVLVCTFAPVKTLVCTPVCVVRPRGRFSG